MNAHCALVLSASAFLFATSVDAQSCTGFDANGNECDVAVAAREIDAGTWDRMSARRAAPAALPAPAPATGATTGAGGSTSGVPAAARTAAQPCSGGEALGMHATGNACALDDGLLEVDGATWERMQPRILVRPAAAGGVAASPVGVGR